MKQRKVRLALVLAVVYALAILAGVLAPYDPTAQDRALGASPPSGAHWLGTDSLGRDQWSRLLFGARVSLLAGLLAAVISVGIGAAAGVAAGYGGGWLDVVVMRLADLFLAVPWLYLLLAVRAALPLEMAPEQTLMIVIGVIGVCGWASPARMIRGLALSLKERDYVLAARGFGASGWHIARRHIFPGVYPTLLAQVSLLAPQYVLAEVSLSFLGLGVGEPMPTWGNLLAAARHYHTLAEQWWLLLPAAGLVPVVYLFQELTGELAGERGLQ
jgi:peptide/nickel transport system permease protein